MENLSFLGVPILKHIRVYLPSVVLAQVFFFVLYLILSSSLFQNYEFLQKFKFCFYQNVLHEIISILEMMHYQGKQTESH